MTMASSKSVDRVSSRQVANSWSTQARTLTSNY